MKGPPFYGRRLTGQRAIPSFDAGSPWSNDARGVPLDEKLDQCRLHEFAPTSAGRQDATEAREEAALPAAVLRPPIPARRLGLACDPGHASIESSCV